MKTEDVLKDFANKQCFGSKVGGGFLQEKLQEFSFSNSVSHSVKGFEKVVEKSISIQPWSMHAMPWTLGVNNRKLYPVFAYLPKSF